MEKETKCKLYTTEEMDRYHDVISKLFPGKYMVAHEIESLDIHLDLIVIEPTKERDHYVVVTMGMGAHQMSIPKDMPLVWDRVELYLRLPSWWNLDKGWNEDQWFWPLQWLQNMARYPINNNTWFGYGHTVATDGDTPVTNNCGFTGFILEETHYVYLGDKDISLLQAIPLYPEEMDFKLQHGAGAMIDMLENTFGENNYAVINPNRGRCSCILVI